MSTYYRRFKTKGTAGTRTRAGLCPLIDRLFCATKNSEGKKLRKFPKRNAGMEAKSLQIFSSEQTSKKKTRYSKRRWQIEGEKHRAILKLLRHGVGICTIAEIVGVGVRTVQRRKELLEQEISLAAISEDGGGIEFTPGRRVCEIHGQVSVWPCVACAAIASRGIPSADAPK